MANEGHIIIKRKDRSENQGRHDPMSIRRFFLPVDKGASKPAFCYAKKMEFLKEDADVMEKNLDNGNVAAERRLEYKARLAKVKARVDQVFESKENAKKIIAENPDKWRDRRKELAEKISAGMPSRKDVKDRRVNPHANLRREKQEGLEKMKQEYKIISRALGEESNVSFLQRD